MGTGSGALQVVGGKWRDVRDPAYANETAAPVFHEWNLLGRI